MRLIQSTAFVLATLMGTLGAQAAAQTAPAAPAAPTTVETRSWQRYPAAREVQLRDVAAIVRVTPENRTDVAISITQRGPLPAPELRMRGDRLVVDGRLRRQIRECGTRNDPRAVTTSRHGRVAGDQLAIIDVRVPQSVVFAANGAAFVSIGQAQSGRVALDGCGDADIGNVADEIELAVAGGSEVRLHGAGSAEIAVAGGGDVTIGVIRNGANIAIAGAGDIVAARIDGPTSIAVQGAGDVTIRDGRATSLSVAIMGAGDLVHNGSAERLDAAILGAGDIRVRSVDGEINRRVLGAGEVVVGR